MSLPVIKKRFCCSCQSEGRPLWFSATAYRQNIKPCIEKSDDCLGSDTGSLWCKLVMTQRTCRRVVFISCSNNTEDSGCHLFFKTVFRTVLKHTTQCWGGVIAGIISRATNCQPNSTLYPYDSCTPPLPLSQPTLVISAIHDRNFSVRLVAWKWSFVLWACWNLRGKNSNLFSMKRVDAVSLTQITNCQEWDAAAKCCDPEATLCHPTLCCLSNREKQAWLRAIKAENKYIRGTNS